jgi:signal peptidase I
VAVGLALLIQTFVVKPYKIPSGSMLPTLAINPRILANRMDTHPGSETWSCSIHHTVQTSGRASVPTPSRG